MVLKMYVYLKEENILADLGIEESDEYSSSIVDLNIKDSTINGFYILSDNSKIIIITNIGDFEIVYNENTVAVLTSLINKNNISEYTMLNADVA